MQWRRRNAWLRRDSVALLVAAGSVGAGAVVVNGPLRLGLRQGIAFLLICVFVVAVVVPLVRHVPLPVLRYGQSVTLLLAGAVLAAFSGPPVSFFGGAVAILGLALLVAKVYLYRAARQSTGSSDRLR